MSETSQNAPEVILLHTNDVHSRLEQAAKIASYIADTRRQFGQNHVLAIDIGDHMDRMRPETEGSEGEVNIALLNAAGYEASTLGNNEGLTFTADQLAQALGHRARFVTVCANMKRLVVGELPERPEWMQPSTVITKGKIKIGLIGATVAFSDFYTLLGWEASSPLAAIARETALLRREVDVIVVMSHLGLPLDRQMAQEIEGIDLILGGHTHHLLEVPERIGNTLICATGKFGEYIGRIEMTIAANKQIKLHAECIPVAAFEEHPEAIEIIEHYKVTAAERLNRVVTQLKEPLSHQISRESPLSNLLAAGIRRWTDAEIGLVNTGQLLGGLAVGDVTEGELHALCPSPINTCSMQLTGRAITEALEQSLLGEFIDKPIRGFGFRGSVLGTLAVDGLVVRWKAVGPPYGKIVSIEVNGEPLHPERLYKVGTIDMFTFGIGYESIKSGTCIKYYLPEFIRGVLASELQNTTAIANCRVTRWIRANP